MKFGNREVFSARFNHLFNLMRQCSSSIDLIRKMIEFLRMTGPTVCSEDNAAFTEHNYLYNKL